MDLLLLLWYKSYADIQLCFWENHSWITTQWTISVCHIFRSMCNSAGLRPKHFVLQIYLSKAAFSCFYTPGGLGKQILSVICQSMLVKTYLHSARSMDEAVLKNLSKFQKKPQNQRNFTEESNQVYCHTYPKQIGWRQKCWWISSHLGEIKWEENTQYIPSHLLRERMQLKPFIVPWSPHFEMLLYSVLSLFRGRKVRGWDSVYASESKQAWQPSLALEDDSQS